MIHWDPRIVDLSPFFPAKRFVLGPGGLGSSIRILAGSFYPHSYRLKPSFWFGLGCENSIVTLFSVLIHSIYTIQPFWICTTTFSNSTWPWKTPSFNGTFIDKLLEGDFV